MEIARIDPYLVKWSSDGTIALATESTGIQCLSIDSKEMLHSAALKWDRIKSPSTVTDRILDMEWSPTLLSSEGGCQLSCVLESGDAVVMEVVNLELKEVFRITGSYTSTCWTKDGLLLLGTTTGALYAFNNKLEVWNKQFDAAYTGPITFISTSNDRIGIVISSRYCWCLEKDWQWVPIIEHKTTHIYSISFEGENLVVFGCGQVTVGASTFTLESYLPGNLITHQDDFAVIHSNGRVSGSQNLGIPKIEGEVVGASVHPNLPMVAIVVNRGSQSWEYPILSRKSVNLAVFPLPSKITTPRRRLYAAPASWLALLMKQEQDMVDNKMPDVATVSCGDDAFLTFQNLFLSDWFDHQRLMWLKSTDRNQIMSSMRRAVAKILQSMTPTTPIDKLVVSLYSEQHYNSFELRGDFINDVFDSNTCSLEEDCLTSINGRRWKRCALTRLPLLSLDTKVSSDGLFTCYRNTPKLINETEVLINPITDALINAANFCIYSGCCWRFNM